MLGASFSYIHIYRFFAVGDIRLLLLFVEEYIIHSACYWSRLFQYTIVCCVCLDGWRSLGRWYTQN